MHGKTSTEDLILNTVRQLRENGVTDSEAVAKVIAVAMDVANLSDEVNKQTGTNSGEIDLKPWESGKQLVRNTAPKHGLNSKMPWEE